MKKIDRRKAIKNLGLGLGCIPLISNSLTGSDILYDGSKTITAGKFDNPNIDKPITVITLGAGSRGNTYGNYGIKFPNQLDIIGVAEPIAIRNERYSKKHNIPDKNRFKTWEHVFEQPKFADAVIISTPDDLHYAPCMKALEMGYDILLEKPIAPSENECRDILNLAKKTGRIVAVCHVLRYAPYFIKLKQMIDSGAIGELISIQHMEPIEHIHMSHSYVRGNWHNSKETTPIILAKSCHDLDILRWLIGKPCKSISAYGSLKWFKASNAPEGSTNRCTDGCAVELSCPYSALKIYHRERQRTYVFDFPEDKSTHSDFIIQQLKTTNYGRCVYKMENDQPDHYITSMEFEDDVTANFSMEAFTSYHGRRTRIMGSMGDIVGDMDQFIHTDFLTKKTTKWNINIEDVGDYKNSGHGGGDWALVFDWIQAVKQQDANLLTSTIDASVESHIMGFMAEKSRKTKQIVSIDLK
ncbi:Gfo/Idh/MocA family oxidoreductase [Seonamhaeicola sediminis]|uniref:Gfo/Idh/MocA family oxidoreductase n=1 Tax=Seonamhaeicola sediminis TaxID=2528206 RepID=A0A562YCW9_9FLAO|nr:Gfo/Idh/MocA family oxidoreductase [Seonamhaeicola sediminis]TWO32488.1 Gfo/Idh/MocA family oxidoreductase [Seonamhaeicola sediminis]